MSKKNILKSLLFGLLIFFGSIVFNVADAQTAPDQPTGFQGIRISGCAIDFKWHQATTTGVVPQSFVMRRKPENGTLFSSYPVFDNNGLPVAGEGDFTYTEIHKGLSNREIDPSKGYTFTVSACALASGAICSAPSLEYLIPKTPISLWGNIPVSSTISSIEALDGGSVKLNWQMNPRTNPLPVSSYFNDYGLFYVRIVSSTDEWGTSFNSTPRLESSTFKDYQTVGNGWSGFLPSSAKPGGVPDHAYGFRVQAIDLAGYGCREDVSYHHKNSESSSPFPISPGLIVPNSPYFLSSKIPISISNTTTSMIASLIWVDASKGLGAEDYFEIQKAIPPFPYEFLKTVPGIAQVSATTTATTTDFCGEGLICSYQVRACREKSGIKACSFWSAPAATPATLAVPTDFQTRLIYVSTSTKEGIVNLRWQDNAAEKTGFLIQHSTSGPDGLKVPATREETSTTKTNFFYKVPLGGMHYFRVIAYFDDPDSGSRATSGSSNPSGVDTDITKVLRGQVWSGYEPIEGLGPDKVAPGIGWISLNSDTLDSSGNKHVSDPNIKYSVQIASSGLVSGFALGNVFDSSKYYEHGYGWISFNPVDLVGCPSAPCEARLNSNNVFSGWAKFMGVSSTTAPGFPGWIKLSGTLGEVIAAGSSSETYAFNLKDFADRFVNLVVPEGIKKLVSKMIVRINAKSASFPIELPISVPKVILPVDAYGLIYNPVMKTVDGAAWGGDQVGWIAFSNTNPSCSIRGSGLGSCEVLVDSIAPMPQSGTVINVSITAGPGGWLWCDANPFYRVAWDYNPGTSGALQEAYEIEFRNADNSLIFSTSSVDAATSFLLYKPLEALTPLGETLPKTFYVSVRVRNTDGTWSQFINSSNITTLGHYPPLVDFKETRLASSIYSFTDTSTIRTTDPKYSKSKWLRNWTFENANPLTATTEIVSPVQFLSTTATSSEVTLTIDDTGTITCGFAKNVPIGKSTNTQSLIRRIYREK